MFRKILMTASCIAIFGGASGMDIREDLVENPIPKIVAHYKAITPDTIVKEFKTSGRELINSLKEGKLKEELDNSPEILKNEWLRAIQILNSSVSDDLLVDEPLYRLRDNIVAITRNGFYDISKIIFRHHGSEDGIKSKFHLFWQLLLQAREIVDWKICCADEVAKEKIPSLCLDAYKLVNRYSEGRNDAKSILLAISIMNDVPEAIEGLNSDGDPSEEEISAAKKVAREVLGKCNVLRFANIGLVAE
jgi:hypothetical protein